MGQLGLNGEVPWLSNTDGALCFICKSETQDFNHFNSHFKTQDFNYFMLNEMH